MNLLGSSSSLTATLAVLIYRFLGIFLSAAFFNAPPYPPGKFWLGLVAVAAGGLCYLSFSQSKRISSESHPSEKKKKN